ncbi:MAG: transglutaminase domain-containing protein [Lachnospirales bacterium]
MKTYNFEFTTKIDFDLPIINHNFILKCLPKNHIFQRIYDEEIIVEPECKYTIGRDSFGNKTINGTINREHNNFLFSVKGKASLSKYRIMEELDRVFLYPSQYTVLSDEMMEFSKTIPLGDDVFENAKAIAFAVYDYMTYEKGETNTETKASDAFNLKKGVCQDYSHITIALMRNAKIPARYVAGFIEGDGETHAWVEYYVDGSWYAIDPTNKYVVDYGYIKLSHGRDSYDCSVERGCFASKKGIVTQNSQITVKVGEIL